MSFFDQKLLTDLADFQYQTSEDLIASCLLTYYKIALWICVSTRWLTPKAWATGKVSARSQVSAIRGRGGQWGPPRSG